MMLYMPESNAAVAASLLNALVEETPMKKTLLLTLLLTLSPAAFFDVSRAAEIRSGVANKCLDVSGRGSGGLMALLSLYGRVGEVRIKNGRSALPDSFLALATSAWTCRVVVREGLMALLSFYGGVSEARTKNGLSPMEKFVALPASAWTCRVVVRGGLMALLSFYGRVSEVTIRNG